MHKNSIRSRRVSECVPPLWQHMWGIQVYRNIRCPAFCDARRRPRESQFSDTQSQWVACMNTSTSLSATSGRGRAERLVGLQETRHVFERLRARAMLDVVPTLGIRWMRMHPVILCMCRVSL